MTSAAASVMASRIADLGTQLAHFDPRARYGIVTDLRGPMLHAAFAGLRIGDVCDVEMPGGEPLPAEVIGVDGDAALLAPFGSCSGLPAGGMIRRRDRPYGIAVGDGLLGRVIDARGRPIDGLGNFGSGMTERAVRSVAPPPMSRPLIDTVLDTGIRAIDAIATLGCGQRIVVTGPPGTGKSSLLAAIAEGARADVIVLGLVGERGREVREFLDRQLPRAHRARVVVVAVTSDRPAMERVYGAHVATAVAEHFRDAGRSVLLMIDSLTRVARALREVGLAAGEAPTRRGYPASVYPALPELIERAGRSEAGDITAIYTVLQEGDGHNDPIAEEVRSLTDGHLTLSQTLADRGHYPAIDVLESLSRVMADVAPPEARRRAADLRRLLAKHAEIEVLIQVGEFRTGNDAIADRAVRCHDAIRAFLEQPRGEISRGLDTQARLAACLA